MKTTPPKSPRVLTFSLARLSSARAVCAVLALAGSTTAIAAPFNWDPAGNLSNSGGTGTWDLSSLLWNDDDAAPNVAWPNLDDSTAVFGGTGGTVTINTGVTGTGITAAGLEFNVDGYTIASSGGSNVLKFAGAAPTITVTNVTDAATISSVITDVSGAGFSKLGAGTLILGGTAANTLTGPIRAQNGTLVLSKQEGMDAIGTGGLVIQSNNTTGFGAATVRLTANEQINNAAPITLNANGGNIAHLDLNEFTETIGALTMGSTTVGSATISTGFNGVLKLSGDLTLNNNRNAAGNTGREVLITGAGSYGSAVQSGTLDLGGAVRTITVNTTNPSTVANSNATIETTIQNGGIIKAGNGGLVLGNNFNFFSGGITVTGGQIIFSDDGALGDQSNTILLNGGGLAYNSSIDWDPSPSRIITIGTDGGSIGGSRPIRINDAGQITGSGTLIRNGTGNVGLDIGVPNPDFTGNVVINSAIVELKNNQGIGTGTGQTVTVNGGQISLAETGGAGAVVLPHPITLNGGALAFNNRVGGTYAGNVNVTANSTISVRDFYQNANRGGAISGLLSGSGVLTVTGATTSLVANTPSYGSVLLTNGGNTFDGTFKIQTGAQLRAIQGGKNTLGTATIELNGGALGLAPSVSTAGTAEGLFGRFYNSPKIGTSSAGVVGGFDFGAEIAVFSRNDLTIDNPSTPPIAPGLNGTSITALWTGVLQVTNGGSYSFFTRSDDGSVIYVDGQMVVSNDFAQGATERTGAIALSPGYHSIIVKYAQGGGSGAMSVNYQGPDTTDFKSLLGSVPNTLTNNGANLFAPTTLTNAISVTANSDIDLAGANATSSGTLTFANNMALRITGVTGSETFTQSGAITLNGLNTVSAGITLTGAGGTTAGHNHQSAGADIVISGNIGEATPGSGLTKTGPRTLTLTGTNTFTGPLTVSEGTLVGNTQSLPSGIINNATLDFDQTSDGTFAKEITGAGTFIKRGQGTLSLSAASAAFTGTTEVRQGALSGTGSLGGNVAIYAGGSISGTSGSTFTVGGLSLKPLGAADFKLGSPSNTPMISTASVNSAGSLINISSIATPAAGTYRLIDYSGTPLSIAQFAGFGVGSALTGFYYGLVNNTNDTAVDLVVETLGSVNTWTGATSNVWNSTTASNWATGAFANGQQITFGDAGISRNITGGAVAPQRIVVNGSASNDYTISNPIVGTLAGGLEKNGANTLRLTGANTFSGAITINGGTLAASVSSNASALGSGAVTLNGGTLEINGTASTATNGLLGRYYTSNNGLTSALNFTAPALAAQVDPGVNFTFNETNKPAGGAVGIDASATTADWAQFSVEWSGKVKISAEGNYAFFTGSDDGSRVFVDGKLIAVNDGGHGEMEAGGGIYLTPGLHDIRMAYTQGSGGAAARLRYTGPGIPKQIIPSSVLFTPETGDINGASNAIQMGNTINVAGNSSINLKGDQFTSVQAGLLNLGSGATLNLAGSPGKQLRTANTIFGGGTITLNTGTNVYLGTVTDNGASVTINKRGSERLVLDNTAPGSGASQLSAGTTFDVQEGTLVGIGSNVAGSTNPLGAAKIQLNGGSLLLDSKVGGVTFDNAVNVLKSGTIAAQPDNQTITLGSGLNGITVASGATLTLDAFGGSRGSFGGFGGQTSAGATLNVVGAIGGAGAVTIQSTRLNGGQSPLAGTVIFSGANTYTGLTRLQGLPHGQPQLELRGSATLQSSSGLNESGKIALTNARLNLNNNAGGNLTDRLPDAWAIEMNHGTLRFDGSSSAESSETIGEIRLKSGENNLFTGTTTANAGTTLTAASLTREGRSTLRFVGNNLGNGFVNSNRVIFTDPSGITNALVGGGGFNGSTNASILPWAYAEQNTFLTYDYDGIRRLNLYEYTDWDTATATDNVRSAISANLAIAGKTVNSYIVDNSATDATKIVTLDGTMNVTSGALLLVGSAGSSQKGITIAPGANGGTINFGAAEGVITVNRVGSSITAQISGSNGLTVTGDNQLLLNNFSNDFTGQITVNGSASPTTGASSLAAQDDGSLGNIENDLVLNGGGFRFNSAFTLNSSRDVTLGIAGGSFDTGGGSSTIDGRVTGPGDLIKVGGNNLTLTNTTNNYTGKTYVLNGQLISSSIPLGDIETHGTYNFSLFDDATYNGSITGTGAITKSGFGTLTLTGTSSYAQGTNVTQGTLKGTTSSLQNGINISSGASVILDQTTDGTFRGVFTGAGIVSKNGTSTITLLNSSSHSGGTFLNAGTLQTDNGNSLGSGPLTISDAKLQITGSTKTGASIRVASSNSTVQVDSGATFTMGGVQNDGVIANGTLNKTGGGTLEVIAPGDFTGSVNVAEGRIIMDDLSALGTSTTTLASGTVLSLRGQQNLSGFAGFSTNGSAAIDGNTLTLTPNAGNQAGSAFFSGRRDLSDGFALSFTYRATGGNGTLKADGFTFTLENDSRGTSALGGTGGSLGYSGISPSAAIAFNLYTGAGSPVGTSFRTNGGGGAYTASGVNFANGNLIDFSLVYDPVAQTLTEMIRDQANPTAPYTNVFSGVDLTSILADDSGFLGFTGATGGQTAQQTLENFKFSLMGTSSLATFTNRVIVPNDAAPTIEVAAATHGNNAALPGISLGSNSTLNVTGATLDANSSYSLKVNETLAMSGAATVNVSNNGTGIGTVQLAGGISGSSTLTKGGNGRLSVAGNNSTTFTGNISLTQGSLHLADANLSMSAVVAKLNSEILGTGTLGSISADGATISPSGAAGDTGMGRLTITGNLSLTSTSAVRLELGKALAGTQPTASDFDALTVGGTVTLADSRLELSIANNGIQKDDIFTIILNNGSSAVSGIFAGLPNGSLFTFGTQVFQISYFDNASTPGTFETAGGNDVSLLAVPEPASSAALVAGVGMLLGMQRFRRSKR